jgi:hypothetical protein
VAIDKTEKVGRPVYWIELEQTAFILWFENHGDFNKVLEILQTDPVYRDLAKLEEGDKLPELQTLRRWARNGFWKHQAQEKMKELIPFKLEAAALAMAYGSEDAANSMMRIARGENVTREDRTVMDASKFILQSTLGDSIVGVVKPVVQKTVDMGSLETMDDIVEAEQRLREIES